MQSFDNYEFICSSIFTIGKIIYEIFNKQNVSSIYVALNYKVLTKKVLSNQVLRAQNCNKHDLINKLVVIERYKSRSPNQITNAKQTVVPQKPRHDLRQKRKKPAGGWSRREWVRVHVAITSQLSEIALLPGAILSQSDIALEVTRNSNWGDVLVPQTNQISVTYLSDEFFGCRSDDSKACQTYLKRFFYCQHITEHYLTVAIFVCDCIALQRDTHTGMSHI